jgi:hypothetical protein
MNDSIKVDPRQISAISISGAYFDELLRDSMLLNDLINLIRETFPGSPELASHEGNFVDRTARLFKRMQLLSEQMEKRYRV